MNYGSSNAKADNLFASPANLGLEEQAYPDVAAYSPVSARADFLMKTYLHVAGAVLVFALIEAILLSIPGLGMSIATTMLTFAGPWSWLIIFGCFWFVSAVAERWAHSDVSRTVQYMGLGLFVAAESIICLPLLVIASLKYPQAIPTAAIATGILFTGMTAFVLITRKNFSFMGPMLGVAGLALIGTAITSMLFGFSVGIILIFGFIALMCGHILYTTSNMLYQYHTEQYVAAALALFAAIATLFWYLLRLVMAFSSDD